MAGEGAELTDTRRSSVKGEKLFVVARCRPWVKRTEPPSPPRKTGRLRIPRGALRILPDGGHTAERRRARVRAWRVRGVAYARGARRSRGFGAARAPASCRRCARDRGDASGAVGRS